MSDNEFEGKCLSEQFGMGTTSAVRSLDTVEAELRIIQNQAQRAVLGYAIEAGQRLEEAKAMVDHGEWGGWLKKMGYAKSTAQNLMRIYREYGANQQSLFGGEAKSQAFGNLSYTKALRLLALPDAEERERFIAENDVGAMSTRELDKAIKEREAALEEAAAAKEEMRGLQQKADRLQEQLSDQARVYEAKLTGAGVEADQAKAAAQKAQEALDKQRDKAKRLQDALSEANTSAQSAEEEHERLLRELEELRSRPVDVAVEVDTEAVEAARKAAVAEMTDKVDKAKAAKKKADEGRKAAEEALADAQRELEELKAREPEVRELTKEEKDALTADAVERARAGDAERLRDLEKKLAASDPSVAEFKVRYAAWQEEHRKMMEILGRIAQANAEQAAKLRQAVQAALKQMGGATE